MTIIDPNKPILVTGGSGYIASWIVKNLLDKGHTVHATVRNLNDPAKVDHLHTLAEGSSGKLILFEADLLKDGSFDAALQGCELAIHTASPWSTNPKLTPDDFIKPALDGTRNVLTSVNKTDTVKRVVLTSSNAAIIGDLQDIQGYPRGVATEEDWNTSSSPKHLPYSYSKTMAEKLAWEMAQAQNRWDLVIINPTWVFGPALSKRRDFESVNVLLQLADGRAALGAAPFHYPIVDVREVAEAHVRAGFQPEASGRHLLFNEVLWQKEIAALLAKHFGNKYPFPKRELPKWFVWLMAPTISVPREVVARNFGIEFKGDNTRSLQDLGLSYRPAETTLVEHFQQMMEDGLI